MATVKRGHLILWGEVAVGKSMLLVTGLCADDGKLPAIKWRADGADTRTWILRQWRRLKLGRLIPQTDAAGNVMELPLGTTGETVLRIVDIQGKKARDVTNVLELIPAEEKAGVLFVCGWSSRDTAEYMAAIEGALPACGELPTGIAITKCDRALESDDPHWRAPPGWWADHDVWKPHTATFAKFGDRVWPTSAYGFSSEGRPACLLDEFGELLPYRIAPRNSAAPFVYFIQELGLWPE